MLRRIPPKNMEVPRALPVGLHVGNLSDDVSEENLRQAFKSFGQGYIQNLFNTIS